MISKKIQICIWLKEIEFSKKLKILKRTQDEVKIKLKISVIQLENSVGECYEYNGSCRLLGFEDKEDELEHSSKEYEILK